MKTRTSALALVLAVQISTLLVGAHVRADDPVSADRRVPKQVLAFASIRNVGELKERWNKTAYGLLQQEPALADIRADFTTQLAEFSQQVEDRLGLGLSELISIPQGEVAVAVTAPQAGKIAVVLLLNFGDREELLQKLLDKAAEVLDNQQARRDEQEFEDTRLITYRRQADEEGQPGADQFGYFLKDSFLVASNYPAALKSVLSRWDGRSDDVLAESSVYNYICERCRDENADSPPQVTWFFDPVGALKVGLASIPQLANQLPIALGVLPTIGVDKLRGAGGTLDIVRGEYDTISRTLIYIEQPPRGVINLFQFDSTPQAPPKWVSADWSSYTAVNWNLSKAFAAAEGLVDMFVGPGTVAAQLQSLAQREEFGNLHLKKDVIDCLSGRVQIVGDPEGGDAAGGSRVVFAVELAKPAGARAMLAKLARIPALSVKERDFRGDTVYEVSLSGGDEDEESGGDSFRLSFAVAENQLLISADVRSLEQVLRGVGDRELLADTAAFKRIAEKIPASTMSIGFNRQDTQMKDLYELLRSGAPGSPAQLLPHVDFSKLPAIDAIKKYLPSTGSYMESDERGLRITSFSLRSGTAAE